MPFDDVMKYGYPQFVAKFGFGFQGRRIHRILNRTCHTSKKNHWQECIPVGYVTPARYRTGGVSLTKDPPGQRPPRDSPWIETPRIETPLDRDPPGQRPPCGQTPLKHYLPATSFAGGNNYQLPSANEVQKGNVFTSICQEFCPGGEGVPGQTPPEQTPPGRHPPWADIPLDRLGKHPPGQTPPPLGQRRSLGRQPPSSRQLLQWTVRIILECILV